ncbi:MAG: peptidase S41, partial [Sulfurimonas sp.]|nr:peptidase S41 [Sulfurimonas sp.]
MNNKKFITLGFVTVASALLMLLSTNMLAKNLMQEETKEASRLEALSKFTKVISIVEQYNVDDLTIEDLMEKSLQGMLSNLDAHSSFLTQKDYTKLTVQTNGE